MRPCDVPAQVALDAANRAATSGAFGRSEGAKRFLRYVVEKSLAGESSGIKEYAIALEVFQRAKYDPKVDSLVRVEATKLRGLLKKYYEGEGVDDPVRIEIPKGGYVPRIRLAVPPPGEEGAAAGGDSSADDQPAPADLADGPASGDDTVPASEPVEVLSRRATGATPFSRTWLAIATGLALAVTGLVAWSVRPTVSPLSTNRTTPQPSLAILPFEDVSTDAAFAHVAAGLTDEITIAVSHLGSVRMPSRSSVRRFGTGSADARQVGRDLGVNAVLEGTSRVDGQHLTVAVALVDTRDGLRLWSEVYQRPLDDLVEVERDISAAIAKQLSLLNTTQRALVRPHSENPEAYQHYLRATFLLHGNSGDLTPAIDLYRAATVADPGYALAWASLSSTLALRAHWGFGRVGEVIAEAEAAARRALALDPTLAEAHQAQGRVQALLRFDFDAAGRSLQRAIELDPASIDLREDYAMFVLNPQGRLEEAKRQLEQSLAIDPQDMTTQIHLAQVMLRQGDLDGAEAKLRELYAFARESPSVQVRLGTVLMIKGRTDEALPYFEGAAASIRSSWVLGHLGWALARAGRPEGARAILQELRGGGFADKKVGMAGIHTALGELEAAMRLLEEAAAEGSSELRGVSLDVRFRQLRGLPGFRALAERVDGRVPVAGT